MGTDNMQHVYNDLAEKLLTEKDSYWDKIRRKENKGGLPYFFFTHNGKKIEIQAINQESANAKFEKIKAKF